MAEKKKITKVICPICKKETTWENNPFKPFCSERCKLIDLGQWASEDYRIAGEKKDVPEADDGESRDLQSPGSCRRGLHKNSGER